MTKAIFRSRRIFKVLVLGRELPLQTGFLNHVSGERVTNQLYNTLGVSLGVASCDEDQDCTTILQLWSLPINERLNGITKTFTKGHKGVIVILRLDELDQLHSILHSYSITQMENVVVVLVGNLDEVDNEYLTDLELDNNQLEILGTVTPSSIIDLLAQKLIRRPKEASVRIPIVIIDDSEIPIFEAQETISIETQSTDQEIEEIKSILFSQGIRVIEDSSLVELAEGTAHVSLRSGAVSLEPIICTYCLRDCKRQTNICIIAVDSGWSSEDIGQRALLTTAKILALAERKLPNHVEMQILRASSCAKFELNPYFLTKEVPEEILVPKNPSAFVKRTLLEVAAERVKRGRLPETAYNMLKRRLTLLKTS